MGASAGTERGAIAAASDAAAAPPSAAAARAASGGQVLAVSAALAWLVAVDLVTNATPARWDAASYVDMAQSGIAGNPHLVAPFAYRPAVPWIAGAVARLCGLEVETGFAIVTRVFVVAALFLAWRLARALRASEATAHAVMGACALSYAYVKLPLFFPALVDGASYAPYLLAFVAWVERRRWACLACALIGLAFKEFLLVPCALLVIEACLSRPRRPLFALVALAATAAVFLGLRAAIQVERSQQFVDTSSFEKLCDYALWVPRHWTRDVNIVLALLCTSLPVLMLATRARWRELGASAGPRPWLWGAALGLVLLLALYGGTNVGIFVSYALPVVIAVLCAFARAGIPRAEIAWVAVALVVFHRVLLPIPPPDVDFERYIDFYGLWGQRLNASSLARALELAGWVASAVVLRALLARRARAAAGANSAA